MKPRETSKTYTYDASDRLIRITSTANGSETEIARYAYDPMGRRIAKTIEGHTTYFLYTDEGLIAELNQQGNLTKAYGWVADTSYSTSPLWQAEPKAGETTITDLKQAQFHTLTTDHLGTVQMATNEAGEVTWKAQSEAFGQTTLDEQNQITMNLRFPGQYFDEETGTHYNYYRDYNPSIGRYIQRDPIGLEGGINWYFYVEGNALKYFDSLGLYTTKQWCFVSPANLQSCIHAGELSIEVLNLLELYDEWQQALDPENCEPLFKEKITDDGLVKEYHNTRAEEGFQDTPNNRCDFLRREREKAAAQKDKARVKRIEKMEKAWKCRNKDKRKNHY